MTRQPGDSPQETHAWAQEAIPWYTNGTLSIEDCRRLETHAQQCALCRGQMARERRLQQDIQQRQLTEYVPHGSLNALHARIDANEQRRSAWSWLSPNSRAPLQASMARRIFFAQAATIAALAMMLTIFALRPGPTTGYETLSREASQPQDGFRLQVVFADDATMDDVTRALSAVGAQVVSGPSVNGLFEILIADSDAGSSGDDILDALRASPVVVFAANIQSSNRPR